MVDASGACDYGYACVYADTISWASPTTPLPMTLDPRMAFENLFGDGGTPEERAGAPEGQQQHSRLDLARRQRACRRTSGPSDRNRLNDYLDDVREIERRIQRIEKYNASGEARALPAAPLGVPDSYEEHVQADVRSAGAGVHDRDHARLRVQDEPRRQRPRVARKRREDAVPSLLASRRNSGARSRSSPSSTAITSACCRISSKS